MAASTIRSLLRGYIHNNRRCFCIDKSVLISSFRNQGLDIANYDLIKEVTLPANPGLVEVEDGLDEGGHGEMTYTSIDYAALFMFMIAALPDFSALEARIATLEQS